MLAVYVLHSVVASSLVFRSLVASGPCAALGCHFEAGGLSAPHRARDDSMTEDLNPLQSETASRAIAIATFTGLDPLLIDY